MHTDARSTRDRSWMQRLLSCHWMVGVLALAEIILGFILLASPFIVGVGVVLMVAIVFILMGAMRVVAAMRTAQNRLWQILSGVAYGLLGAAMLLSPLKIMEIGTLIAGGVLIFMGVIRGIVAMMSRRRKSRVWLYLHALVSFTLGLIVCGTWPESSLWLLGVMVAIEMIFSGWTMLFLSLASDDGEGD